MKKGRKEVRIKEKPKYTDRVFSWIMRNPEFGLKAISLPIGPDLNELKVWHPDISETGFKRKLLTMIVFAFYQTENEEYDPMMGFKNSVEDSKKQWDQLNERINKKAIK
jgi:hypothetical protein